MLSRYSLARNLLLLWGLCACAGHTELRKAGELASHAGAGGGSSSGASGASETGAGAGVTDGSAAGGSRAVGAAGDEAAGAWQVEADVCDQFAPLWHYRATATTDACDYCLEYGECTWPSSGVCVAGSDCVDRHCSTLEDGAALCDCIASCFSVTLRECNDRWAAFMTCATSACENACHSN